MNSTYRLPSSSTISTNPAVAKSRATSAHIRLYPVENTPGLSSSIRHDCMRAARALAGQLPSTSVFVSPIIPLRIFYGIFLPAPLARHRLRAVEYGRLKPDLGFLVVAALRALVPPAGVPTPSLGPDGLAVVGEGAHWWGCSWSSSITLVGGSSNSILAVSCPIDRTLPTRPRHFGYL